MGNMLVFKYLCPGSVFMFICPELLKKLEDPGLLFGLQDFLGWLESVRVLDENSHLSWSYDVLSYF